MDRPENALAPAAGGTGTEEAVNQQRDAITELETWTSKHKSHCCEISIDDGYGATCWRVNLYAGDLILCAQEVAFLVDDNPPPNMVYVHHQKDDGKTYRRDGTVVEDADWPGLAATILAAVDAWYEGCARPKVKP